MDDIKIEIENKIYSLEKTNIDVYNILINIIKKDDWIKDIPFDVFINVLNALGYSNNVAIEYYKIISNNLSKELISKEDELNENI